MKPKYSYSSKLGYDFKTSGLKRQSNNYSPIPFSRRTLLALLKGRCRRKNLYYHFLLVLVFHSFVLGVYFLVFH